MKPKDTLPLSQGPSLAPVLSQLDPVYLFKMQFYIILQQCHFFTNITLVIVVQQHITKVASVPIVA
jgi:hypothetical protein